jgi:hypothetical protein
MYSSAAKRAAGVHTWHVVNQQKLNATFNPFWLKDTAANSVLN